MGQEVKRFYEFGPFRIDTEQRLLMRGEEVVPLTPKAADTLLALLANSGRVIEKDELIKAVWPETFVEEGGLARNISMLRKALGDDPEDSPYIETIPKRGYRFVAPVRELGEAEALAKPAPPPDATQQTFGPAPPSPPDQPDPHPPPRPPIPPYLKVAIGAAALVIAVALLGYLRPWTQASESKTGVRSLVVLPLDNISKDATQDYFADGMTEALLTPLTKIGALKVVSYSGSERAGRQAAAEIARQLRVDAALEGSVLSTGNRFRISVRLVKAETGENLWAEEYERDLRDILSTQSELALAIAREIQVKATPQEQTRLAKARPVDPEAYHAYLKGRFYAGRRTIEGLTKSVQLFQEGIQRDPGYALAYCGLADAYALLGSFGYDVMPPLEARSKAQGLVARALAQDDSLPEAHVSLAYLKTSYDWDFPAAEKEFQRALELNPGYATAHHWYAHYFMATGHLDRALEQMKQAQELEPLSLIINTGLGWSFYYSKQYDQAIEQYQKVLEMEPGFRTAQIALSLAKMHKGPPKQVIPELQQFVSSSQGRWLIAVATHGGAQALAGNAAEAQRALKQLDQQEAAGRYVPALYRAGIYSFLHQDGQALAWAKKAINERSEYLVYVRVDPTFERLRMDPQFQQAARAAGLELQ